MPVYLLGDPIGFPPVDEAEDGLVAVGGDLGVERLLLAYSEGIFPWYSEGQPILWHSPDPRFVLTIDRFRIPRSLRRAIRNEPFKLTMDHAFGRVVEACAETPRPGQDGTWITEEMKEAYADLHRLGFAHSVETWDGDELVGGLYGVSLGDAFFGESMFSTAPNASKLAFVGLASQLEAWGLWLIDCQVRTDHLARFGAEAWPRERYIDTLREALQGPTRRGTWAFETAVESSPPT